MRDPIGRYLDEIGRIPLLTPDEEIELARCVKRYMELKRLSAERELTAQERREMRRGERAKRRFVEGNLRLVVYIAKKYASRGMVFLDMLDLIQEGTLGLMRAVELFDPERGYKFSTYCYWWCRQGITRAISQQERLVRLPSSIAEKAAKLPRVQHELQLRLGRYPRISELAEAMAMPVPELELLLERGSPAYSLDAMISNAEERSWLDAVADPASLDPEQRDLALDLQTRSSDLDAALHQLPEREQFYIRQRYGLDDDIEHTWADIARSENLSRERVRQVTNDAVRKLRLKMAQTGTRAAVATASSTKAVPAATRAQGAFRGLHPWEARAASAAPSPQCEQLLCG